MMALLLAAAVQVAPVKVVAITASTVGPRSSVTIEGSTDWRSLSVKRNGDEVVVTLAAEADSGLEMPAPRPPIESLAIEHAAGELRVRVKVPSDVPYQLQREGKRLTLFFEPAPRIDTTRTGMDLYRSLFPSRIEPDASSTEDATQILQASSGGEGSRGISLGPLRLQPALLFSYVDAESVVRGPEPVRDQYFRVEPQLGAQLVLWDGRIRAHYEPHLRFGSKLSEVNVASHDFDAGLDLPVGTRLKLNASDAYTVTLLDASKADPGREFFYNLGHFTRNDLSGGAALDLGGRLELRVGAGLNKVRFSEDAGFFSYEQQRQSAALAWILGDESKVSLTYAHEHVPAPATHPVSETTSNSLGLSVSGTLPALIQGNIGVGWEVRDAPQAAGPGSRFRGATASAGLHKELSRGARISLEGGRETYLSAFEQNAFYVSNAINMILDLQLPFGFSGRGGAGYRWNTYQTDALALGMPRHDEIFSWTAGVGRSVTRWSYLRVDYAHERRDSNIDGLDSHSRAFIVQLGLTPFGAVEQPK